jgi:radical SAM superfamily enzyme YgiQ (UPF0313 family)
MNIVIVGINPESEYNLAPALLKSYCLKDPLIAKDTHIMLKWFSIFDQDDNILKEIMIKNPTIVAFSCYVWNINKILKITKSIRKSGFKGSIVLGGPEVYPPIAQQILFKNPSVDIIVRGEGEATFSGIVKHFLSSKKNLDDILGITFRKGSKIVENKPRSLIDKLDEIPSPYLNSIVNLDTIGPIITLETYRGCAFRCNYCLWHYGEKVRYFSLKRVKQELIVVMNSNIKRIWFADSICNFNKERFKKILRIILRNNPKKVIFDFEMKAEFLDEEMIGLLSRLPGGGYIAFGLQSANSLVLKNINRKWNKKIFERNIKLLQKKAKRIDVRIDLIYGLPGDTYESYRQSFGYAMSFHPHRIQAHLLWVLPGTDFYNNAAYYGIRFMKKAPHNFLESTTFSRQDCKKAQFYSALYDNFLVKTTVNQLNKCLGISCLEIYEKLLKYLNNRMSIRKIKIESLLKHLASFIKINLSCSAASKNSALPLLELIKYLHIIGGYESGAVGERKGAKTKYVLPKASIKPDNIKVEKFHYNIKDFAARKLFDKEADIKDLGKKSHYLIYNGRGYSGLVC